MRHCARTSASFSSVNLTLTPDNAPARQHVQLVGILTLQDSMRLIVLRSKTSWIIIAILLIALIWVSIALVNVNSNLENAEREFGIILSTLHICLKRIKIIL